MEDSFLKESGSEEQAKRRVQRRRWRPLHTVEERVGTSPQFRSQNSMCVQSAVGPLLEPTISLLTNPMLVGRFPFFFFLLLFFSFLQLPSARAAPQVRGGEHKALLFLQRGRGGAHVRRHPSPLVLFRRLPRRQRPPPPAAPARRQLDVGHPAAGHLGIGVVAAVVRERKRLRGRGYPRVWWHVGRRRRRRRRQGGRQQRRR